MVELEIFTDEHTGKSVVTLDSLKALYAEERKNADSRVSCLGHSAIRYVGKRELLDDLEAKIK